MALKGQFLYFIQSASYMGMYFVTFSSCLCATLQLGISLLGNVLLFTLKKKGNKNKIVASMIMRNIVLKVYFRQDPTQHVFAALA